jgi:hypothetical protein
MIQGAPGSTPCAAAAILAPSAPDACGRSSQSGPSQWRISGCASAGVNQMTAGRSSARTAARVRAASTR